MSILKIAVSHRREADGVPGPNWRKQKRPHGCIWLSFFTVVFSISIHVLDPISRLGTPHKRSPVSIPPTALDLQSLTICAIWRQAAPIIPFLASTVAVTDFARPPDEMIWPSHLKLSYYFFTKKAQTSAHASFEVHTSTHTSFGAQTSIHTSLGAHTSKHISTHICTFLPRYLISIFVNKTNSVFTTFRNQYLGLPYYQWIIGNNLK